MKFCDVFSAFAQKVKRETGEVLSDKQLAKRLGFPPTRLSALKARPASALQIVNMLDRYAKAERSKLVDDCVKPIIEFFEVEPVRKPRANEFLIFDCKQSANSKHDFYGELFRSLSSKHGIYVFHDSRGRAVYAGKAVDQNLWAELNNAFNRDRKEVQSIKRVSHPVEKGKFGVRELQIVRENVALHHVASYVSAYEVPKPLIGKFEALLVRSFANDLLNVRMEHFTPRSSRSKR